MGSFSDFALARYNPDGSLDTSFGANGIVTTDFDGEDAAVAVSIAPDGKIVAAGTGTDHIALARYNPNGTLDPTFGNNGTIVEPGFGQANGLALTPQAGSSSPASWAGTSCSPSTAPTAPPTSGSATSAPLPPTSVVAATFAENLVVDAQGRIILVGRATSPTILDMALARCNPDGTLDTSFANHGTFTADFHGRGEFGQDVALDSAGRIIAAGYTANGSNTEFALMRANPKALRPWLRPGALAEVVVGQECTAAQSNPRAAAVTASHCVSQRTSCDIRAQVGAPLHPTVNDSLAGRRSVAVPRQTISSSSRHAPVRRGSARAPSVGRPRAIPVVISERSGLGGRDRAPLSPEQKAATPTGPPLLRRSVARANGDVGLHRHAGAPRSSCGGRQ